MSAPPDDPKPPNPNPQTAAEFHERAVFLRWKARELREEADHAERLAFLAEARAAQLTLGIDIRYPEGTVMGTNMQAPSSPSAGANISAAKSKARLPLQVALIKRNASLPEWVEEQNKKKRKLNVETAKSWLKKSPRGARKVPRSWADRIAAEFVDEKGRSEVPATAASWPNGINEDE